MTYVFIDNMTHLFDTDTGKYFQNKLNLKHYSDFMYSGKTGPSGIPNRNIWFL
jgi:hypothetical protein